MTTPHDPRPLYRRGLTWVTSLLGGVAPDQRDRPTAAPTSTSARWPDTCLPRWSGPG